jgi:hypothetical protein
MKHPMQDNILANARYREQARLALDVIRLSFYCRIHALRTAYDTHSISSYQLNDARKALMFEASGVLSTHPGDNPQKILVRLKRNAKIELLKTESFSVARYVADLSNC